MTEPPILLQAAGSNVAQALLQAIVVAYLSTAKYSTGLRLDFVAMGTGSGICRLKNWTSTCQVGDIIAPHNIDFAVALAATLSQKDYQAFQDLQMYPMAYGGVVPVFNLPFQGSESLILTGPILAQIYLFNITSWCDSQILAQNPAIKEKLKSIPNPTIRVFGRADSAGASLLWTTYLANFASSNTFVNQIGVSSSPKWKQGTILAYKEVQLASFISQQSGSIGYLGLYDAKYYQLQIANIRNSEGGVVSASVTSLGYAGIGMMFGNNGDTPDRLTASLLNPKAGVTWPISGFLYLVMRKATVRPGATCQHRYETVKFWSWFYTSPLAQLLVSEYGFAPLSADLLAFVLQRLQSDITCDGQAVFMQAPIPPIPLAIPLFFKENLQFLLEGVYKAVSPQTVFAYSITNSSEDVNSFDVSLAPGTRFRSMTEKQFDSLNQISFPFAAIAYCFIYNICGKNSQGCTNPALSLNGDMIVGILSGTIKSWNDTRITTLNPNFTMVHSQIHLFYSDESKEAMLSLKNVFPSQMASFSFHPELVYADDVNSEVDVLLAVESSPHSIALLHFNSYLDTVAALPVFQNPVTISKIIRNDGSEVYPQMETIAACTLDTYDKTSNQFDLSASRNFQCYPLTVGFDFLCKKNFVERQCDSYSLGVQIASFLSWILRRGILSGAYTSFMMYPLFSASDEVYKQTKERLLRVSCNGVPILGLHTAYHYISSWAFPLALLLTCVTVCAGASFAIWIHVNRSHKIIRFAQPEFLYSIIFGAVLMVSTLVPLSLDDKNIEYYNLDGILNLSVQIPKLDTACRMAPWLYLSGFSLEFSALFVKVLRLKRIFVSNTLKKMKVTAQSMAPLLVVSLLANWVVCASWTAVAPLHWQRFPVQFNAEGFMVESYARCASDNFLSFYATCAVLQLCLLVCGMVLCYQTRNVQEDVVENKWITIVLVNMTSILLLTTLLGTFMHSSPSALFAISVLNTTVNGMGTMMFVIIPKVEMFLHNQSRVGTETSSVFRKLVMQRIDVEHLGTENDEKEGKSHDFHSVVWTGDCSGMKFHEKRCPAIPESSPPAFRHSTGQALQFHSKDKNLPNGGVLNNRIHELSSV